MNRPRRPTPPVLSMALLLLAGLALLSACGGAPPVYVQHYMLAYPPPAPGKGQPLPAALKVARFAAPPEFNTQRMTYAPGGFKVDQYPNQRWQGYPADMVSGLLGRDLADSGRFAAVFGPSSPQIPRFIVDGGVVKFWEEDLSGGGVAQLEVQITLLDIQQSETVKRVMFQKKYVAVQPMAARKAQDLAQALSQAMARVSRQVLEDVHQAVAQRLSTGEPPLTRPTP